MDRTYEILNDRGLAVSRRLASRIGLNQLREDLSRNGAEALDEHQATRLRAAAVQLRETIIAESSGVFAYVTAEKRLDVGKLVDDPQSLLPPGVFARLSTMAQTDVQGAFRCIAFERPMAAAFHLMRAIEESLRQLFAAMSRSDQPELRCGRR